jgi:oligoendopeptidase F
MTTSTVQGTLPARSDVPVALTWDLSMIFATDEAWDNTFAAAEALITKLPEFKGKLKRSGKQLHAFLSLRDRIGEDLDKLYVYASMKADQDTANTANQEREEKIRGLLTKYSAAVSWSTPELLSLKPERLETFLAKTPALKLWKQQLDELDRERPHVRTPEVEELLAQHAMVSQGPQTIFGMFDNADIQFPMVKDAQGNEHQLTHGSYGVFLHSRDVVLRENTYRGMMETFEKSRNTVAAIYSAQVQANIFRARARRYGSSIEAALGPDNVPISVYKNLVATAHEYLPVLQRYMELKRRELEKQGQLPGGKIRMWDLYAPVIGSVDYHVDYEKAQQIILEAVKPLGTDYVDNLRKGFGSRWVDVLENKGKRSGAYSGGAFGTAPYMLMNWKDKLEQMFTLAHEAGHSMHSFFSRRAQPFQYANYTIFVAEVASTCNEALLAHHLLEIESDPAIQAYLIDHQLDAFRATFFRQTLFAEFEMIAHELAEQGVPLTADKLSEIFLDLNKKYYGDIVMEDDPVKIEWARIPHFYNSFYVYKYATGISAATALSAQILNEGAPAVERYLKFLSGGCSDFSINLLQGAGVDLSTPAPIKSALDVFTGYLDQLEKLIDGNK